MAKNKLVTPFLKWVGGKRQLVDKITPHLPKNFSKLKYFEPFIGGGALFFHFQKNNSVINDFNSDLINTYLMIRDDLDSLLKSLGKHKNTSEYFYKIRELDRNDEFRNLSNIERASRLIYLNKTCYNGLYRVNSAGEFNSPFGSYNSPNIINEPVLRAVSTFLNDSKTEILNVDYYEALKKADKNSFVYFDPPYHPVSDSSSFTGYVQGGWCEEEQVRLKEVCDELTNRKIKFLLSNSSANLISELYKKYEILTVKATRAINSAADKRGAIDELLIRNYE